MFWKRKQRVDPEDLVDGLMVDCLSTPAHVQPLRDDLTAEQRQNFDERAVTYQIAAVLLALMMEAKRRPEFSGLPNIVIKKLSDVEGGESAVSDAKDATRKLGGLVTSRTEQYTWARGWYADIGGDETNPAVVGHLAMSWLNYVSKTAEILRGFKIA